MIEFIRGLAKLFARKLIKVPLNYIIILLEHALFVVPTKSKYILWCKDKIGEKGFKLTDSESAPGLTDKPPDWMRKIEVKLSGVFVVLGGKLLMCRPLKVHQRLPDSRKAIVCTKNNRPIKLPDTRSLLFSFALIRRNLAHWLKKEGHGNISGKVALLGNSVFDNSNYYHFWADVVADIWYIRQHLSEKNFPEYYLVPHSNLPWQWDVLDLCGVKESQVISYAKYDVLSVDELIIPVRDKGAINLPQWLCRAIHEMSDWKPKYNKGERLIFVSRADADRRRVVNENLIRNRLVEKGFEVHTLNGLSVTEQQQLFSSASIICAPHGASLTNIVWCRPGTIVIDFLSEKHLNPCFKWLALQNKIKYYPFVCRQVEGVKSGINGNIVVSNRQVELVIELVANNRFLFDEAINH